MTLFQQAALALTALWLLPVALWFRKSTRLLAAGLLGIPWLALMAAVMDWTSVEALGLAAPASWPKMAAVALGGLLVLLGWSPVADRIATRFFPQPPDLRAFRALQSSPLKAAAGIALALFAGGFLEELILRGIVLQAVETGLGTILPPAAATAAGLVAAAACGWALHLYQGPRAALIVGQLSFLFGLVFVAGGHSLWTVILCHGLYDTIAFVRFALKKSKYADLDAAA